MSACKQCQTFFEDAAPLPPSSHEHGDVTCSVCLGLFSENFALDLERAVRAALQLYGGPSCNKISQLCPPSLALPGDMVYRFTEALSRWPSSTNTSSASAFVHRCKAMLKETLGLMLERMDWGFDEERYPACVHLEEQGYLCVHVLVCPISGVPRPHCKRSRDISRRESHKRRIDEDSQGGDPRINLEARVRREGIGFWSVSEALDSLGESDVMRNWNSLLDEEIYGPSLKCHVAVWRRPFYLRGYYTKSRRDISQSPFFVVEQGKKRRLGLSSVEEQIVQAVERSCHISIVNNDITNKRVVYGKVKFHASGREDMDVRMLLHPTNSLVKGRPFVCEIVDALLMPSMETLADIVREINHDDERNRVNIVDRAYGRNPMGVGVSDEFSFAPASAYSSLQADTEEKVKHYGCCCWSEGVLPEQEELSVKTGCFPLRVIQRTPIRVLHRRANIIRCRQILSCKIRRIDDHFFWLNLSTEAGTYVKEFVHGDLCRTVPSVSTILGCRTDILELDCEGIEM